uniref:Ig-like domain-containing protein n=1 Tax=Crocodylus porosus TaxID=8502 RepID=A0A7M4EX09_CROPO
MLIGGNSWFYVRVNTELLFCFTFLFFCSSFSTDGSGQVLKQTEPSITKAESRTIRINCYVDSSVFGTAIIHWYRQRPGAAPERILYFSSDLYLDQDSDKRKISAEKDFDLSRCVLTINSLTSSDTATYYCATWTGTA